MVRLVVLVFLISFVSGCSSILGGAILGESSQRAEHHPKNQQSYEVEEHELTHREDILRLDEGKHHPAVQMLLTQAEDARQQGHSQQALSYLDRARQIQPRNSAIFYRQAWLNYQVGNMQQAQQLLQRASVFLRGAAASRDILQRRIKALQKKVEAKLGLSR